MKKVILTLLILLFAWHQTMAQNQVSQSDQQKAAMYLNECIYTLTKIESSKNRVVLEEEQYKLNNILAWEGVSPFRSVVNYRKDLQTNLNSLIINYIEKERYQKAFERKNNAAARDAIFSAISGVQVNVNLVSLVSNVVLSSARAIMDYNKTKEANATEHDEEMWTLKKEELTIITGLRNSATDVIDETFGKHGLKENMRLTGANVKDFLNMLSISDPDLRVKQLSSKESTYQYFPQYWYEKGFAYIDLFEKTNKTSNLTQAWKMFDKYESMMKNCKLYRYDGNLGMIALYELKYKNNLSISQKEALIKTVVANIKENGNALLYCALQYFEMQKPQEGFRLLSQCLNDEKITAKNEMVLVAAMAWNMLKDEGVKSYFLKSIVSAKGIELESYIAFMYAIRNDKTIDQYELHRNLQKSVTLVPSYSKNDISKVKIDLKNPEKFLLNTERWEVVRYDYQFLIDGMEWNCKQRASTLAFSEPEKYFKSREALAKETKYLKDDIQYLTDDWVSKVKLGEKDYYYVSSSKTWEDVKAYFCKNIPGKETDKEYIDEVKDRRKYYEKKFQKKYGVDKVEVYYCFNDKATETVVPDYSGPICKMDVHIKSEDSCNVVLCFRTDYIEKNKTTLRFWGVQFGDDFVKF